MNKQKIYLTGLLAGTSSKVDFEIVSALLRNAGFTVVLPCDMFDGIDVSQTLREKMTLRIKAMLDCDVVVNLDNYEKDLCASCEVKLARSIDMPLESAFNFLNRNGIKYNTGTEAADM